MDFQPGVQEGLIASRGAQMVHELGIRCPRCRTSDPAANLVGDGKYQQRSPDCARCGGDGWIYRDPFLCRGLITSIRQDSNPVDVGIVKPGDSKFSIDPSFGNFACAHGGHARRVSEDDKFTQTWDSPLDEGQGIVRGASTLGDNARVLTGMTALEDRLWYEPGHALWCEDEDGRTYAADSDFELGPGKVIRWTGNKPAVGRKYVVKYTAYFEWLVWAPPQERIDRDNRDLGPLIFLRKRHIAFVNDSPFVTPDDRVPIQKRVAC